VLVILLEFPLALLGLGTRRSGNIEGPQFDATAMVAQFGPDQLFGYPKVLARHQTGPSAEPRERFLAHCAGYGAARGTLLGLAKVEGDPLFLRSGKWTSKGLRNIFRESGSKKACLSIF